MAKVIKRIPRVLKDKINSIQSILVRIRPLLNRAIIKDDSLPMTQFLILLNISIFVLQMVSFSVTEIFVFRSDVWYSYISSCFLHGSVMHLAGNMLFFAFITPVIEKNYGSLFIFIAYIVTGIGGNALTALFSPEVMSLGASGSICGLMSIWLVLNLMKGRIFLVIPALFYIALQGIQAGISLVFPAGIGYMAHFGSAITGLLFIPFLIKKRK